MELADSLPILMFFALGLLLFSGYPVAFILGGIGLAFGLIGIARHDLRGLFAGRPLDEWEAAMDTAVEGRAGYPAQAGRALGDAGAELDSRAAVSGEVLRRFALEDVIPGGVGELHRAGDLFIEDLRGRLSERQLALRDEAPGSKQAARIVADIREMERQLSKAQQQYKETRARLGSM